MIKFLKSLFTKAKEKAQCELGNHDEETTFDELGMHIIHKETCKRCGKVTHWSHFRNEVKIQQRLDEMKNRNQQTNF